MIPGKNLQASASLLVLIALLLGSCASKPAAPEPEPAPIEKPAEPAPEPKALAGASQADLDALLAKAKELKKKSFDLKLFEVLPEDYKASEAKYASAVESHNAASKDAQKSGEAKAALDASIASYEALIAKGVVALAEAKREQADQMKATALKAGADAKAADRFQAGEKAYAAAAALVESGKHEPSVAAFEEARLYFELAYKRSVGGELRAGIAEKDYAKWDSGNNQLAENKYAAEEGMWATGALDSRASGVDLLDEAILRFNLVVQKGRQAEATGSKQKSDDAKQKSEEIKAQVAVKQQYDEALAVYERGVAKLTSGEYEEAKAAFDESKAAFDAAYDEAAVKRAKAKEAMEAAAAAAADSARKAQEADALVGQAAAR